MTRRRSALAALLLAATMLHPPQARAFGDTTTGAACSVTVTGDATDNKVTCNFGLTPEQLKDLIAAVTGGAVGALAKEMGQFSHALGVTQEAARSLLRIVGEEKDIPPEKLGEALSRVAQDYKRLLAQAAALNTDNPTAKALVEQAKADIDAGRFKEARELLSQATAAQVAAAQQARALAEQARAAEEAQLLGAAESTALTGDVALTQRDYLAAADLFRQAAGFLPPGREALRLEYLDREAEALYRQGDERGDNAALLTAIARYEDLLRLRPRDKSPDDWAMTQGNLATALTRLGERESDPARLEQAVEAYRNALEEHTREQVPFDWALTQNNLGTSLQSLGERENSTALLEQAVEAYRNALEERTREQVPFNWALTQNNLGTSLQLLGERENSTALLEQAVEAYNAALLELTREKFPLDWAMTQNNLGGTLFRLGQRETGTVQLKQALNVFNAALQERTRERTPLYWAMTQSNRGNVLSELGERESDPARLERAVEAYNAALLERTRERVPLDWAGTQKNLGVALGAIIKLTGDAEKLPALLTAWRGAAEVYRQAGMPHEAEPLEGAVKELEALLPAGAAK
jgi:tetratricopeptide (TPR) repeat protein